MTHTTKHTPGPWEVVGSRICTVANDIERITLAKTEPGGAFAMSEQQEANATLLAAAPAMYAALKACLESLRVAMRFDDGDVFGVDHNDTVDAMGLAETALSQAEGRDK